MNNQNQDQAASKFEGHYEVEFDDQTAVAILVAKTGLSVAKVKRAMQAGAVWMTQGKHTQRLRRAKKPLRTGQVLHLYYDENVLSTVVDAPQLIADQGAYSIWFKPYGVWSQGSKWGDHCTLARYAELNLQPERTAFIVHRLDRATRGLMLLAHSKKMAAQLSSLFADRKVHKVYQAIVKGQLPFENKRIETLMDDKTAVSHIERVRYDAEHDRSLVQVTLETGRKHQVRRHLALCGNPIVGDRLYGGADDKDEDLELLAYKLSFALPEQEEELYIVPDEQQLKL